MPSILGRDDKEMSLETWPAFVATVLALMSTPGPSQLLMLSNSVKHGLDRSAATALGDLTANAIQMLAAGLGLAAVLAASPSSLTIVKWFGVLYLFWLGSRMIWRARSDASQSPAPVHRASLKMLWLQGFLTSAANPKAIVFFAALFPQFIDAAESFWLQFVVFALTYTVLDAAFLSAYGGGASWVAARYAGRAKAWVERAGGGFMIGAALLLGSKSVAEV